MVTETQWCTKLARVAVPASLLSALSPPPTAEPVTLDCKCPPSSHHATL